MDKHHLEQHLQVLGWLHVALGALLAGVGIFGFFFLTGIGLLSGDAEAIPILGFVGIAGAGFMIFMALPGIIAGYGLLKRTSWGRIVGLVVAFLDLFAIPVGTAIGIYAIWVLTQEEAVELFESAS